MLNPLKTLSLLLKNLALLAVAGAAAVSGYTLWYNAQVYAAAENVRSDLYALKPAVDEKTGLDFDELRKLNPDVVGWLTVNGTKIDYPVVQGQTNMTYMNKDVYGKFSLAGSIFLDTRNNRKFTDRYSIIYGHHMENHAMFGDLDLFKDESFFNSHRTATILTDEEEKIYQVLAYAELPDSVQAVFDPTGYDKSLAGLEKAIQQYALNLHTSTLNSLVRYPTSFDVVALVTCAGDITGSRAVLFLITPRAAEDESGNPTIPTDPSGPLNPSNPDGSQQPSDSQSPDTGQRIAKAAAFWTALLILSGGVLILLWKTGRKQKKT